MSTAYGAGARSSFISRLCTLGWFAVRLLSLLCFGSGLFSSLAGGGRSLRTVGDD